MFDFWHTQKVDYLRRHNCLNFNAMRHFGVPNRIIKQVLLEEVCREVGFHINFLCDCFTI
jgi:hypothetical protein